MVKNLNVEDTVLMLANDINANNCALFMLRRENKELKNDLKVSNSSSYCANSDNKERIKQNKKYISTIKKDNRVLRKEIKRLQRGRY